ncbi:MAG: heme-degrading domain-containing protein [Anaerorhabdus sp.]|uniref:heme-degrading domain-containing protein n=1 Tax=Anaerorhabdus sp. TaxID=1872524 RepID=UPI002FCBA216
MTEEMILALEEEKQLQFKKFNAEKALRIGQKIANYAIEKDLQVCVEIVANGKMLFHFSADKCIPDNDHWLKRKINTVMYFHHSSKFIHFKLNGDSTLIHSKYGLKTEDYAVIHGGFPIYVENAGFIGAIAVSGLQPNEDHDLVTQTIQEFLD